MTPEQSGRRAKGPSVQQLSPGAELTRLISRQPDGVSDSPADSLPGGGEGEGRGGGSVCNGPPIKSQETDGKSLSLDLI